MRLKKVKVELYEPPCSLEEAPCDLCCFDHAGCPAVFCGLGDAYYRIVSYEVKKPKREKK